MSQKERFKVTPAVYIVFRRGGNGNEILLLKRANTGYMDGYYSLPAGHLDGDEPAAMAAVREAQEEVGVALKRDALRLVHIMHRQTDPDDRDGKHERIDIFFEATAWTDEPVNNEPEKCSELRWASLDNLPDKMIPEVKQALEKIGAGEVYSDFNFDSNVLSISA